MKCGTWAITREWVLGHYCITSFDDVSCLKLPPSGGMMNRWWLLVFRPECSKKITRCQNRGISVSGQYIIKCPKLMLGKGHKLYKSFFLLSTTSGVPCTVSTVYRTCQMQTIVIREVVNARSHSRLHVQCGCGTLRGSALLWQLELWRAQNPWRIAWNGMRCTSRQRQYCRSRFNGS